MTVLTPVPPRPSIITSQPPATPPCGLKPTANGRAKSETAPLFNPVPIPDDRVIADTVTPAA